MSQGAHLFINSRTENVTDALAAAGVDCIHRVIECVGIPVTAQLALSIAGRGATVVLFGVSDPEAIVPLKWYEAFTKELVIKTSYINPHTTARAIRLLAAGALDVERIISRVISMEEAVEEFRAPRYSRLGKVLVAVHPEEEK